MANSQRNKKHDSDEKVIVEHGKLTVQMAVVEPPPPNFASKFRTLQDWLINICDENRPQKKISKYEFGLFESVANHIVFLVGVNTYEESDTPTSMRIDFEPKNMYFKLPESDFQHLNTSQLLHKLTSQLKEFANTENFKSSFFAEANIVVFETNGETIWSKQQ